MSQTYEKIGEIREMITLQVSARGEGLCLYLPKQLCETYGIIAGHRLKVMIRDHFRPRTHNEKVGEGDSSFKVSHSTPHELKAGRIGKANRSEADDLSTVG
jgi:hypothetical protein